MFHLMVILSFLQTGLVLSFPSVGKFFQTLGIVSRVVKPKMKCGACSPFLCLVIKSSSNERFLGTTLHHLLVHTCCRHFNLTRGVFYVFSFQFLLLVLILIPAAAFALAFFFVLCLHVSCSSHLVFHTPHSSVTLSRQLLCHVPPGYFPLVSPPFHPLSPSSSPALCHYAHVMTGAGS